MRRPAFELAGIFRQHGEAYRSAHKLPLQQLRVMRAIEVCRTAALGGHVEKCSQCDLTRIAYNSCRNRHCPKCQNSDRADWLESRKAELLPDHERSRMACLSGDKVTCIAAIRVNTFMWSSPFPKNSPASLSITRRLSAAFSSKPLRRRCSPLRETPNTWAPRSVSSPFCTPGGRIYSTIRTFTA